MKGIPPTGGRIPLSLILPLMRPLPKLELELAMDEGVYKLKVSVCIPVAYSNVLDAFSIGVGHNASDFDRTRVSVGSYILEIQREKKESSRGKSGDGEERMGREEGHGEFA